MRICVLVLFLRGNERTLRVRAMIYVLVLIGMRVCQITDQIDRRFPAFSPHSY